jgi:hypothetical protein
MERVGRLQILSGQLFGLISMPAKLVFDYSATLMSQKQWRA